MLLPLHGFRFISLYSTALVCNNGPIECIGKTLDMPLLNAVYDAAGTPYAIDLALTYGCTPSVTVFVFMRWLVHVRKTSQ